jgi:hypothetical protein
LNAKRFYDLVNLELTRDNGGGGKDLDVTSTEMVTYAKKVNENDRE